MKSIVAFAFWMELLSAYAIAYLAGHRPERVFINMVAAAVLATAACQTILNWRVAPIGYLFIDAALLVAALVFATRHDRYWPIWFAAFQTITVASELERFIFPIPAAFSYGGTAEFWSIPALLAFAAGVLLDRNLTEAPMDQLSAR